MSFRKAKAILCDSKELPKEAAAIHTFVRSKGLDVGDCVRTEEDYDDDTYIVFKDTKGLFTWVKNPDEYGFGALHIPVEVTQQLNCPNAVSFYHDWIDSKKMMTIRLSPTDSWVVSHFGKVPSEWEFEIFAEGSFSTAEVHVHLTGKPKDQWEDIGTVADVSRASLERFLNS